MKILSEIKKEIKILSMKKMKTLSMKKI